MSKMFDRWCRDRGLLRTYTDGDNFRGNGRAEGAIAQVKRGAWKRASTRAIGVTPQDTGQSAGSGDSLSHGLEHELAPLEEYAALVVESEAVEPIDRKKMDRGLEEGDH